MAGEFIKVQPAALEVADADLAAAHMGERMSHLQATTGRLAQDREGRAQATYLGYRRLVMPPGRS